MKLVKAHGNSEVERNQSETSYVLTSQRSRLSDEYISAIRLTKDTIRVTGSGHVHKMLNHIFFDASTTVCLYSVQ